VSSHPHSTRVGQYSIYGEPLAFLHGCCCDGAAHRQVDNLPQRFNNFRVVYNITNIITLLSSYLSSIDYFRAPLPLLRAYRPPSTVAAAARLPAAGHRCRCCAPTGRRAPVAALPVVGTAHYSLAVSVVVWSCVCVLAVSLPPLFICCLRSLCIKSRRRPKRLVAAGLPVPVRPRYIVAVLNVVKVD